MKNYKLSDHQNLHTFSNINLCLMSYFKSFSTKDAHSGTTSDSIKEWNETFTLLLDPCKEGALFFRLFRSFISHPCESELSHNFPGINNTIYFIYNNIIIIFQFKTKVKTREDRSAVSWQLINRPWFVAWTDGDVSRGEVQNKFCYILQNKN